ncbi:hypothetical protein OQA88_4925 [Cercophora sp. LCS_1]
MFDINWDEEPERVGERRARKEFERGLKKKAGGNSFRESVSTRSSASSTDKGPGFLENIGLKISNASLRAKRGSPIALQTSKSTSSKRASTLSQSAFTAPETAFKKDQKATENLDVAPAVLELQTEVSALSLEPPTNHAVDIYPDSSTLQSDGSTYRSSKGSEYSKLTKVTTPVSLSPSTKTTKLDLVIGEEKTAQVTETTTDGPNAVQSISTQNDIKSNGPVVEDMPLGISEAASLEGLLPTVSPLEPVRSVSASEVIDKWFTVIQDSESPTSPPVLDTPIYRNESPITPHLIGPKLKPPSADCVEVAGGLERSYNPFTTHTNECLDLHGMQREITLMTSASAQIVITRLNEDWGKSKDASFYKELEMEKKRWMLSALYKMHRPLEVADVIRQEKQILALFESQATASYLAACQPNATLTHLGTDPLSTALFPNVEPIVSSVCVNLPLAANTFTMAHSLSLPSLMPGKDIPRLLKNIHRCLAPKGKLYLILIDPSPASQSVGPNMRHWLDQNLMLNVEAGFRCLSPTRLFPAWLADARLRANGSVITKLKFRAICKAKNGDGDGNETLEAELERVNAELQSTVGRKLWQEVWGSFALGKTWWWDDPSCVEECLRLGTYFEISLIEAVKDTV